MGDKYHESMNMYCKYTVKYTPFCLDILHRVPLTMSSVTTSRFLCIKIIDCNVKKLCYNEYPLITSSFFCIVLLVVSGTQCTTQRVFIISVLGQHFRTKTTYICDRLEKWTYSTRSDIDIGRMSRIRVSVLRVARL